MNKNLSVIQLACGPMDNFVYILSDPQTKEAVIIDPAWNSNHILNTLKKNNFTLKSIWLTHGHHDHTNAIPDILEHHPNLPIYISEHEIQNLTPDYPSLVKTKDKEILYCGDISVQCLHTPGHTPGGQCFYSSPHLIAGDTLFINGCF